jgi:hypothetical protein
MAPMEAHEYVPYASTVACKCHTVRTARNRRHRYRLAQCVERRLDCARRERRNLCGRQFFLPAHLCPSANLFLEAEDGRRPPVRLLNCANGGNPCAQPIVGSSRTALFTSSIFLWDRALLAHSKNFDCTQANARDLQEISRSWLFAPSEVALRTMGGCKIKILAGART